MVSLAPRPLYPHGKRPQYPLNRKFGGTQTQYGSFWRKEIFLAPAGVRNPSLPAPYYPARSLMTISNAIIIDISSHKTV